MDSRWMVIGTIIVLGSVGVAIVGALFQSLLTAWVGALGMGVGAVILGLLAFRK